MTNSNPTYAHCAVQLNLFSLIKVTGLNGVAGGVSWALIITLLDMLGLIKLVRFQNYLINLLMFPLLGGFFWSFVFGCRIPDLFMGMQKQKRPEAFRHIS